MLKPQLLQKHVQVCGVLDSFERRLYCSATRSPAIEAALQPRHSHHRDTHLMQEGHDEYLPPRGHAGIWARSVGKQYELFISRRNKLVNEWLHLLLRKHEFALGKRQCVGNCALLKLFDVARVDNTDAWAADQLQSPLKVIGGDPANIIVSQGHTLTVSHAYHEGWQQQTF
jgi:hypothetical protein